MPSTSTPRAAMSVATSTRTSPDLKPSSARWRAFCDPAERSHLRNIERLVKRQIAVTEHGLPPEALTAGNVAELPRSFGHEKPRDNNYKRPKRRFNPRGGRRNAGARAA